MNIYTLLAVLAVIGSSTSFRLEPSVEENYDRIINGSTARPGQFPYMVSLRVPVRVNGTIQWLHNCGGSIISNRWILSAAHCVYTFNGSTSRVRVVVGAHHLFLDGITHTLSRGIRHPNFTGHPIWRNDVGLLQTTRPIVLNNRARIIPLRRSFVGAGLASVISGWGLSHNPQWPTYPLPTHLQFLHVRTLTNEQCRARHQQQHWPLITPTALCVLPEGHRGTDSGDSGSPLVANGQQIGLHVWGVAPRARGLPTGTARISEFTSWIQEHSGVTAV